MSKANIPITEIWDRTSWENWDTYAGTTGTTAMGRVANVVYPWGLNTQQHIDVATFLEPGWAGTGATFGYISSINHWPGATIATTPGINTVDVDLPAPVDLTTVAGGFVVLTLPNWPGTPAIDLGRSYIDFSSDNFGVTTCSLQFAASSPSPSTAGNVYVKIPVSALTGGGVDFTKVNAIRIRIAATTSTTVYLMALRIVGPYWVSSNVDFDDSNLVLRQTIPLDGDPAYVVPNNQIMPQIWRSAIIPGVDDPRPINVSVSFVIGTGINTHANSFTLYMREQTSAYITQLNLEGTPQSVLTGETQPTGGVNEFVPRTVAELNTTTMGLLDGQSMLNLERVSNPQFSRWQAFNLTWGPSPSIHIFNSADPSGGYTYIHSDAPTLGAHTEYFVRCDLVETGARMRIWEVAVDGLLGLPIFDTLLIEDGFTFVRQGGRIGFQAFLFDGDAYVRAIRPNSLVFAEYQSAPLESHTPVSAARLYARFTPNTQLFQSWVPLADTHNNTPYLTLDKGRSTTGVSTAVTINSPSTTLPVQGIYSNVLTPFGDPDSGITDFDNLSISFDLWFPTAGLSPTLFNSPIIHATLINPNDGRITLAMPKITGNQWQSIKLTIPPGVYPSGPYTLRLELYNERPVKFWIDNVQVTERAIAWAARSVVDDPWHSNYAPFTPFHELINSDTEGVRFTTIGNKLQIQAQALRQDAAIFSPLRAVPIYAQLGRFVFPDSLPVGPAPVPPTAHIVTHVVSEDVMTDDFIITFNGTTSSAGSHTVDGNTIIDPIVSYQWSFGDGQYSTQPVVTHDFHPIGPTTYIITLTVVDSYGQVGTATAEVDL